ncbi:hypothetical protein X975_03951, partial [Stegodyphus mimosarum]
MQVYEIVALAFAIIMAAAMDGGAAPGLPKLPGS